MQDLSWIPPWLARVYSTARTEFGRGMFTVKEVEATTELGAAKARVALSRLCAAGWVVRLARGRYIAVEPEFIMLSLGREWADGVSEQGTYPVLQAALGTLLGHYGRSIVSLALFGSAARGRAGKFSDLDILVVAEGLSSAYPRRLEELEPVQAACSEVRRAQWPRRGNIIPWTS
jgi:hypothetical protein